MWPEEIRGQEQAVLEGEGWFPAELLLGQAGVEHAAQLLAGHGRAVALFNFGLGDLAQGAEDGVDRGLDPGGDVDLAGDFFVQGEQVGPGHVAHVNEVAGLLAAAVDGGRLAAPEFLAEDGHHPGLAERVLPRSIHV